MYSNKDEELFCQIAIDLDFLTQEQVDEALHEQKIDIAIGFDKPIGGYLLEKELLTKDKIGKILKIQERMRGADTPETIKDISNTNAVGKKSAIYNLVLQKCNDFRAGIVETITNTEKKHIYIAPKFNTIPLEKAISIYAQEVTPDVVILHWDKTLTQNGEEGFIITHDSIYWKTESFRGCPKKLRFNEIASVKPDLGFLLSDVKINNDKELCIATGNKAFTKSTAAFLKELTEITGV